MSSLLDSEVHRRLGAALFNQTWELLQLPARTAEQVDEMIHMAHASRYHWGETGRWPNMAAGEWQCSRVYAVLQRAEPALWHAHRSLQLCEDHAIGDYRLAAAYEALARAALVGGDREAAASWKAKGLEACATIANPNDRKPIQADLDSLNI